jgi:oxygen-independent coproporphyrinogen-3 oxidase
MNLSALYIHVPFCEKKCAYCNFYSITKSNIIEKKWLQAIKKEAEYYQKNFSKLKISSLYIGGGTPSILNPKNLKELLQIIFTNFKFQKDSEKTIEMNPESVSAEKLKICKDLGINRISLGLQSLLDNELKILGRIHTSHKAVWAVAEIKKAGFKNINIDYIFGLPGSSKDSILFSLEKIVALKPTHISTYALSIEEGSKFAKNNQKKVTEKDDFLFYQTIVKFLKTHDFNQYEVSAFAKKGFRAKHNFNYWTGGQYIGLGAGAHSFFSEERYFQPNSLTKYLENPLPKISGKKTANEELLKEYIMCNLRILKGINVKKINEKFGIDFLGKYQRELGKLEDLKLIKMNKKNVRATKKGLYVLDEVIQEFL